MKELFFLGVSILATAGWVTATYFMIKTRHWTNRYNMERCRAVHQAQLAGKDWANIPAYEDPLELI